MITQLQDTAEYPAENAGNTGKRRCSLKMSSFVWLIELLRVEMDGYRPEEQCHLRQAANSASKQQGGRDLTKNEKFLLQYCDKSRCYQSPKGHEENQRVCVPRMWPDVPGQCPTYVPVGTETGGTGTNTLPRLRTYILGAGSSEQYGHEKPLQYAVPLSTSFTLDTYAHITASMQKQVANAVGSLISGILQS